ncbi:hypothetical protein VARIO8X_130109 [Burkholderiales bacterium 8X]|nr:hypothetical protein VARIO8X_130109 [Burkholderiales bacterium 8X]
MWRAQAQRLLAGSLIVRSQVIHRVEASGKTADLVHRAPGWPRGSTRTSVSRISSGQFFCLTGVPFYEETSTGFGCHGTGRRERFRASRHGGQAQKRRHQPWRAGFFRVVVLDRRRQVRRLPYRDGRAHHRRHRQERWQEAHHQLRAGHLAKPHPAGSERYRRSRMRIDHQQCDSPEGRRLRQHHLRRSGSDRSPQRLRHQGPQGPERQDRGHDHRHHLGPDAAQERTRARHRFQGSPRQGPRRQLPAARKRPCRCLRHGRLDPRCQYRQVEEANGLQDRRARAVGRADRLHGSQGRRRIQETRQRIDRTPDQGRLACQALRQVVHAADPAEQRGAEPAAVRCNQGCLGIAQRQADGRVRQEIILKTTAGQTPAIAAGVCLSRQITEQQQRGMLHGMGLASFLQGHHRR